MKNGKLLLLAALGVGAVILFKKKPSGPYVSPWESPEGKGWAPIQEELYGWFPEGSSVSQEDKRAFMDASLPRSVTMSDWQKFAKGAPFGGGYTQQDKMLLEDTLT